MPAIPRVLALSALLTACGAAPAGPDATSPATTTDAVADTSAGPTDTTQAVPGDSSTTSPTGGSASDSLGGTTSGSSGDPPTTDPPTTGATTTGATTTGATTTSTTQPESTSTGESPLLTLEHVQVKGTHNSYHLEPAFPVDATHEYSHAPLADQLESQGVRAFELDVHEGFSDFEVFHISVVDSETTCATLHGCLGQLANWSQAHPQHLPLIVWIEIKDQTGGFPIDAADLDTMDDVIREAVPPGQLFTPDELQADHPSLRAAIDQDGWPALDAVRGQMLVVLLNVDDDHASEYTQGYTTLAGRAMFARATPAQFALPWAAIAKLGIGDDGDIAAAHAAHLLIATNVCSAGDADDVCAARSLAAQAAGIHMLKDDFPAVIDGKAYALDFPDGNPARCNPVTAPPQCTSLALEDL